MTCRTPGGAALLLIPLLMGCAQRARTDARTPSRPAEALVVLLPDADGTAGAATVANRHGQVLLDRARAATTVAEADAPKPAVMMSEGHVRDLFADVLAAFPPTPQRFTLYFRFESEELTPESRARIPDIVGAVRNYPAPEVVVIGHTDTTGAPDRNYQLGLRRARTVRDILAATQVEGAAITVSSHGEADPLVPTRDEVLEPRNRRVEITVR